MSSCRVFDRQIKRRTSRLFNPSIFRFAFLFFSNVSFITFAFLPAATKLGQGNVFTGVCDSVHRGGVSASVHAGIPHPPKQASPPEQALPESRPPRSRQPPQEQTTPPGADNPPRSRHPWEQTLPAKKQTPAYGQRAAGTHPTGMHSCFHRKTKRNPRLPF